MTQPLFVSGDFGINALWLLQLLARLTPLSADFDIADSNQVMTVTIDIALTSKA